MNELEVMRSRACNWTLADDSKLITLLSSLVDSMLDRAESLDSSLSTTASAVSRLHGELDTAESAIGLYSGTHFIEQRVLDDDYRPCKPSQPEPAMSLQQRQSIILGELRQAVNDGLNVIDTCFRPLGDENDPLRQYEPVDRYNRPIPPLIGSDSFHAMGRKKAESTKEVTITVDRPATVEIPSPIPSTTVSAPSPSSPSRFIGISAYPPSTSTPPPPPPPMPVKVSPTPSLGLNRSSLQAEITSVLAGAKGKGEFRVPHDKGPEDVDSGLTPPLPPRSVHPTQSPLAPVLPPRGSVQYATPPELPPKAAEKPSTSSVPLPAEPKKKSIFDFDSDDEDFAAVLSRPSKTAASSSTLSSSMRSNESGKVQEEKKEAITKPTAAPSLVSELAAAAASKRAQQLASTPGSSSTPPPLNPRSVDVSKKTENPAFMVPPFAASTPDVNKEEKVEKKEEIKNAPMKSSWAPKKSIFDDEDSDFDELFKPATKKTANIVKKEEAKKEEPKKVEVKKEVEAPKPTPIPSKQAEKPKRKNIFDDDSDFEDLFKPKASTVKKSPSPVVKKEETPKPEEPAVPNPLEPLVSKLTEEKGEEREEPVKVTKPAEHKEASPPPVVTSLTKVEESQSDLNNQISVDPVESEKKEEVKEEKKEEEEKKKELPLVTSVAPEKKEEVKKDTTEEPPRTEKAFSPVRESPPPFEELASISKSSSAEPVSIPEDTEETADPYKKDLPVHFDSPPPFVKSGEKVEEKHDEGEDGEDSDTEVMQGNRAAFMAQLNAKLAAKPPSGMGIRPVSMVETPSAPFVPPFSNRQSVVIDRESITRRAKSETKAEGPISHVNKTRPKGPARRPPTTKRFTSSSDSDEGATKSSTLPKPASTTVSKSASPTVPSTVTKSASPITVPSKTPPKSPVAASPTKEAPVVFRKTSDPKPPASVSRKSSSSSLGPDADPLSAFSAVHTSPYKGPSASKPPTSSMSRVSLSSSSTSSASKPPIATSSTQKADAKPKKSVFDSDSDDFFEKLGASKTLPAKSSAFKGELEASLAKEKKASTSTKKGLFDDSDDDLEMFRKKK